MSNWKNLDLEHKIDEIDRRLRGGVWDTDIFKLQPVIHNELVEHFLKLPESVTSTVAHLKEVLDKLNDYINQYVYLRATPSKQELHHLNIPVDGVNVSPGRHFMDADIFIARATAPIVIAGIQFKENDYIIRASVDYWMRMGGFKNFTCGTFPEEGNTLPISEFKIAPYIELKANWELYFPFLTPEQASCSRQS